MAQPSSSLASQIRGLLPQPRGIAGQDRKVTLCFDRGGWSPDLFADIIDAGFHLLTYRKNDTGKDAPALPGEAFTTAGWAGDDVRQHQYDGLRCLRFRWRGFPGVVSAEVEASQRSGRVGCGSAGAMPIMLLVMAHRS
jgi:hypothetical protein